MKRILFSLLLTLALPAAALADFLEYQLPGTPYTIILQGGITVNPGGTVSLRHPKFGILVFDLEQVPKNRQHKVASTAEQFRRKLNRAVSKNDAQLIMEAARWGLSKGLLRQFYSAVDKALEVDPQCTDAQRVIELKKRMKQPIGDSSQQESQLRKAVRKRSMKIAQSDHFILLHDTPDRPAENRRKPRAQERLDLLEQVYESFLMKFYSQGVELEIPKERLMVVLFHKERDYLAHARRLDPELSSAVGFWDSQSNISVFYDQGTGEQFKGLKDLAEELQDLKEEALRKKTSRTKDIVRLANTFILLIEVAQENSDIEVVSHEATHQMAGNTGLLPRHVMVPSWVHEGLATYFEAPDDASWSGMGAVNRERLSWYRALQRDREHSNIDFIVGDQIFDFARTGGATLHGYGQAWALTHFLMERHFEKFMKYYRRLGEMPPDITLSAEVLTRLFSEVFGEDRKALDDEWREYMDSLQTDFDKILEEID